MCEERCRACARRGVGNVCGEVRRGEEHVLGEVRSICEKR